MRDIIQFENFSIQFGLGIAAKKALIETSWTLPAGKVCGIVGESGSGKSLSSLAIMGLLPKEASCTGKILLQLDGQDEAVNLIEMDQDPFRKLRGSKLAMIFQEPMSSLNPVMKCGAQITEAIQQHSSLNKMEARKKCIQLFEEVQLPRPEKIFDSYPHEISGGQKQRVMIAMALSSEPELIIADEPTTALDVTVQKGIIELLRKINQDRGISILFISHDLPLVSQIADYLVVMKSGKVLEQGAAQEVFANPTQPYTKALLACRPQLNLELSSLPAIQDFADQPQLSKEEIFEKFQLKPEVKLAREQVIQQASVLLEAKNLRKEFVIDRNLFGKPTKTFQALKGVSLEIKSSETLGLVGESGCGKSTLGRSILRLIEPDAGDIIFEGRNITKLPSEEMRALRRQMQIIFQDPYSSLNPKLRIKDALMEVMTVHQIESSMQSRRDYMEYVMHRVGMDASHLQRFPREFSGGQRQRISIARALVMQPKLIVCDESVSALDVSVQAQVLNLLAELRDEFNLSYLFISHDLSVIKHISDRIAVMQQGEIIETANAADLFLKAKNPYTEKLIEAIPQFKTN